MYLIKRSFLNLSINVFRPIYLSIICQLLDYGMQACRPYIQKGIHHVERVRRFVTRMLVRAFGLPIQTDAAKNSTSKLSKKTYERRSNTCLQHHQQRQTAVQRFFHQGARKWCPTPLWETLLHTVLLEKKTTAFSMRMVNT